MHARPMISASVTTGLIESIRAAGVQAEEFLWKTGLDASLFLKADGFLPCSVFAQALEDAARLTSDDCFGLHFGERFNPKNISPLVYAVLNSPTIAAACETLGRYVHVHNGAAKLSFAIDGDLAYLHYLLRDLEHVELRQFTEFGMSVALNTFRIMVGSQWAPREVHFVHKAPNQISEHQRIFRAPVSFDCATNAFVMERKFCEQPVPAADTNLFKILNRYLDDVLNRMPREDEILTPIRKTIAQLIKDGGPKLARAAKALGVSPRTLQRQLKNHGIDFKELVVDTRRRFALDYLRDRDNTLTEIAFLLGYSEVSAFNRAFKRWTGATPMDYRRSIKY
jgi:AraC-like DNA-binding protein